MELFIVVSQRLFSHSFEMTMYLGAACCDFKTDKNKKVLVMGGGCSRRGQRARVGSPGLSAGTGQGTEEPTVHNRYRGGRKALRKGHALGRSARLMQCLLQG